MDNRPYVTAGELADYLNCSVLGDRNKKIYGIALYNESRDEMLSYVPYKKISEIKKISAGVILTRYSLGLQLHRNYIVTKKEPYFYLADAMHFMLEKGLYGTYDEKAPETAADADISDSVPIGNSSVIGNKTRISSGAVIGRNVKIGDNCIIGANSVIGDNTVIDDNVIIGACCNIGNENFEFCRNNGEWSKIPVLGNVHIAHNVMIGGNVVIEKGTIGTTEIGAYTQIENLVQIGHEAKIGMHCHIVACAAIAGWAEIGNHVDIYGQAAVSNIKIGDNVIVFAKSGVDKNIKENMIISGFPAQEHKKELRFQAFLRRLFRSNTDNIT